MGQGIPEEVIDEIRQRTDLVGLVGEYVKLERSGKNMVGLCPFHGEKTPSFTVSPDKQMFRCFGCGVSGNVFSLVMQLEKLTFPEAARFLAQRAGIRVPEHRTTSPAEDSLKEKTYALNLLAARFYVHCLRKTDAGKKAHEYLQKRGITQETSELFMLGYAPANWSGFYDFALKKGYQPELMIKAGLVSPGKDNSCYDRFRDRVIFPIFNISGKVVGFGGRALGEGDKSGPKYLNSPETPVFEKGSVLYGLNLAREQIRLEKRAIVMEGYTDVISAFQAGIRNAVATLGTSLTMMQGRLLRSQADTVVTAYDSDNAGEAATWRGLTILQDAGCRVLVAVLPEGSDPDSYIRKFGAADFVTLVNNASPLLEYRLDQLKKRFNLGTDKGRADYTEAMMALLLSATNLVEQDYYLKMSAEQLGVSEDAMRGELKKRRGAGRRFRDVVEKTPVNEPEKIQVRPAEKILIALMLQSKGIAQKGRNLIQLEHIYDERVRNIMEAIWDMASSEVVISAEKLLNQFDDQQICNLISEAVTDPALQDLPPQTAKRMAEDCISQLRQVWSERQVRELQRKLKEMEDQGLDEQTTELLREHQSSLREKESSAYRSGKGEDLNG